MTARDTVHALLTGYLVSVLTLAWLAAAGGLLWLVGAVWGPVLTGALTWLQVWGGMLGLSILSATMVGLIVTASIQMWRI